MATGSDIIEGALRKLKVISPEIPVEDHYIANGLVDLNDFGNQLESVFPLGFTSLGSATTEVNIPLECIGMYKSNLAIYLAPQYGLQPDLLLMQEASTAMNRAKAAFSKVITTERPSTLPIGSGNHVNGLGEKFFPENTERNF